MTRQFGDGVRDRHHSVRERHGLVGRRHQGAVLPRPGLPATTPSPVRRHRRYRNRRYRQRYPGRGIGNDHYLVNAGEGPDIIDGFRRQQRPAGAWGRHPVGNIVVIRAASDANDAVLTLSATDIVTLKGVADATSGVDKVIFADGTVWTKTDLANAVLAAKTTAAADAITGTFPARPSPAVSGTTPSPAARAATLSVQSPRWTGYARRARRRWQPPPAARQRHHDIPGHAAQRIGRSAISSSISEAVKRLRSRVNWLTGPPA